MINLSCKRGLATVAVSLTALMMASGPALAQTPPPSAVVDLTAWPSANSPDAMTDAATLAFVEDLLARMTVEEKVGQVIQADIGSITPADLATYPLGSILAGGNSAPGADERAPAQAWVELAQAFRAAAAQRPGAKVPLMFGIDAVHGHNNVVGATLFPHNIGLGATRNPELIERIGVATALEVAATGADWTFGPTVAVPRDDRWGRTYEGYGEDPEIVAAYAGRMTLGLQGALGQGHLAPGHIAGSAKHYLADGGTLNGKDQGDAVISERELIDVHAAGYPPAIDAGVLTIMASFSSWNGVKHTANPDLLTDVLRGPLGFDGFVVGDWNAHGQIEGCTNESCAAAFNAGLDMFMAPDSWKPLYENTLAQVKSGEITMARLDEAVRRILTVKVKTGVFEADRPVEGRVEVLGSPEHRALAREAVRQSLVLLKNNGSVLPIRPGARVLVAGSADDIGQAAGGWTINWQGTGNTRADFPNGQSVWEGLKEAVEASGGTAELNAAGTFETKPDVAIVVFGEEPYAEFQGDLSDLDFRPREPLALLRRLKAEGIPTVAVFLSGRPLYVNPEINASDAFVAAWLPGSEGGGIADVLVAGTDGAARHDFRGRLSFSWPRSPDQAPQNRGGPDYDPQFAYGFGLTYAAAAETPALAEVEEGSEASSMRFFADGRFVTPWSLVVRDEGGEARIADGARGVSPRSVVTVAPVDGQGQESARLLTFTGPGQAIVTGPAIDLSGPDYAGVALTFRYRIDAGHASALSLGLGNGVVRLGGGQGWQQASVPLRCFASGQGGLTGVDRAWILSATAAATVAVEDIRLDTAAADTCPASVD
ncbi:MAG: glycoside hydrolase family 3 C-terminal domain-containing protein [Brevundimonas sp.]|uniref:glycoside hydrolase family 3 protein n=1 Tax=Brevundimonas sp. TaxID=1871086 RepID=UPI001A27D808|nr:glycoside hydrolase family 3 protein [Brevundimonas sp.]MBJ7446525.1 glycoside hydrolase family 3 C-terminal domain-containing protein [Brevundimonas sp.]